MQHDWLDEFHRTGNWLPLADWLVRHNTYLARGMAGFVESMATGEPDANSGEPTARQIALLVSLRGGVEALMRLEALQQAVADDHREEAVTVSGRPRHRCGRYSKATGKPCGNFVTNPGDKCGVHRAKRTSGAPRAPADAGKPEKRRLDAAEPAAYVPPLRVLH